MPARPLPSSSRTSRDRSSSRQRPQREFRYSEPRQDRYELGRSGEAPWRRELDADLMAMNRVWQMLRLGAVRMLGEIGRQY